MSSSVYATPLLQNDCREVHSLAQQQIDKITKENPGRLSGEDKRKRCTSFAKQTLELLQQHSHLLVGPLANKHVDLLKPLQKFKCNRSVRNQVDALLKNLKALPDERDFKRICAHQDQCLTEFRNQIEEMEKVYKNELAYFSSPAIHLMPLYCESDGFQQIVLIHNEILDLLDDSVLEKKHGYFFHGLSITDLFWYLTWKKWGDYARLFIPEVMNSRISQVHHYFGGDLRELQEYSATFHSEQGSKNITDSQSVEYVDYFPDSNKVSQFEFNLFIEQFTRYVKEKKGIPILVQHGNVFLPWISDGEIAAPLTEEFLLNVLAFMEANIPYVITCPRYNSVLKIIQSNSLNNSEIESALKCLREKINDAETYQSTTSSTTVSSPVQRHTALAEFFFRAEKNQLDEKLKGILEKSGKLKKMQKSLYDACYLCKEGKRVYGFSNAMARQVGFMKEAFLPKIIEVYDEKQTCKYPSLKMTYDASQYSGNCIKEFLNYRENITLANGEYVSPLEHCELSLLSEIMAFAKEVGHVSLLASAMIAAHVKFSISNVSQKLKFTLPIP